MTCPMPGARDYRDTTRERIARLIEHGISVRRIARAAGISDKALDAFHLASWNPTFKTQEALEGGLLALEELLPPDMVLPYRPRPSVGFEERVQQALASAARREAGRRSKLPVRPRLPRGVIAAAAAA